jgi:hypothetical protein
MVSANMRCYFQKWNRHNFPIAVPLPSMAQLFVPDITDELRAGMET